MFGIKENQIDEERVIFLQFWFDFVRDEGHWKSGRSLILICWFCSFRLDLFAFRCGGRALGSIYQSQRKINSWDLILVNVINGVRNFGFILKFK
jgi:hypothetical protein